jgi:N-acetylglucosaminyldiphosphoundecaprenol N-acetyl-beta-D-mannosaminyltransferase
VKDFISHNKKFYIVTPNPELVLASQTNPKLKSALNDADLAIPDGVGLRVAEPGLNIIKGRELFLDLTKLAKDNNWKVFLLGGMGMEAELAAKKLGVSYAKGPILDQNTQPVTEVDKELLKDAVDRINKTSPDLLFVAFGNPKQEIWIHENLSKLNVGGAMAVGGTFRYVAGLSKLPPKWMEELGLEWIWRLITEPYRFGRVFQALVVFPLKVFWYRVANS